MSGYRINIRNHWRHGEFKWPNVPRVVYIERSKCIRMSSWALSDLHLYISLQDEGVFTSVDEWLCFSKIGYVLRTTLRERECIYLPTLIDNILLRPWAKRNPRESHFWLSKRLRYQIHEICIWHLSMRKKKFTGIFPRERSVSFHAGIFRVVTFCFQLVTLGVLAANMSFHLPLTSRREQTQDGKAAQARRRAEGKTKRPST